MSDILRDSDKKNEIPKVKIPKFATGGICNDAIFPKLDVFSQIDEIVRDIQKQKDNAMAMEFTKCIGELLRKNGVVPKLTEYTANRETDNTFEARFGVSIDELDFSEHDKVFEDKIANLEKQIAYMKEKKNYLRTRCMEDAIDAFDRGSYGALTIVGRRVDFEAENKKLKQKISDLESLIKKQDEFLEMKNIQIAELKQRIAELESKESVKPMRIEFHADNEEMLTPLEVANSLINQNTFKVDELRELAEHLQVYCRHHNDKETETISF